MLPKLFSKLDLFESEILPKAKKISEGRVRLDRFKTYLGEYYPFLIDYRLARSYGLKAVEERGFTASILSALGGDELRAQYSLGEKGLTSTPETIATLNARYGQQSPNIEPLFKYCPNYLLETGIKEEYFVDRAENTGRGANYWRRIDRVFEDFNLLNSPLYEYYILLGYLANSSYYCRDLISKEIGYFLRYVIDDNKFIIPGGVSSQQYFERRLSKIYRAFGRYQGIASVVENFGSQHWTSEQVEVINLTFFLKISNINLYSGLSVDQLRREFLGAFLYSPLDSCQDIIREKVHEYPGILPESSFERVSFLSEADNDRDFGVSINKLAKNKKLIAAQNHLAYRLKNDGWDINVRNAILHGWMSRSKLPAVSEKLLTVLPKEVIFDGSLYTRELRSRTILTRARIKPVLRSSGLIPVVYEYLDSDMNVIKRRSAGAGMSAEIICAFVCSRYWAYGYWKGFLDQKDEAAPNIKTLFPKQQLDALQAYLTEMYKVGVSLFLRDALKELSESKQNSVVEFVLSQAP